MDRAKKYKTYTRMPTQTTLLQGHRAYSTNHSFETFEISFQVRNKFGRDCCKVLRRWVGIMMDTWS
jgi:hypothetical protein